MDRIQEEINKTHTFPLPTDDATRVHVVLPLKVINSEDFLADGASEIPRIFHRRKVHS